ncbi:hypothetical protein, conserved [Babesia ovata]|uniref:Extracellular matrix-binding ebh n=1 Tax=Babesia ovata TaxID=189622 RepID=A0A2H6KIU2_9APIC|nr:uncharacterized protein BOVATA_044030 [Babesia ovata]GBE62910.1 hypothetical protein, conserved [Babesia ovata]
MDPVGPLNQLKTSIPQKINDLTRQIEELKNQQKNDVNKSKNASEIDKLNKDLQSHNASLGSLDTLKALCGYANKVNSSPSGECEKLLTNLCSGLQTFLGYNEKSKGYDGSGIVYSDLDRLCDGVMSFLHGVLESVKDDESVTTYDNNNDINNVLRDLHDNVGKGRKAFGNAVDQVSEWLKNHGAQVDHKTTDVFMEFSKFGHTSIVEKINYIAGAQGMKLQDQLTSWRSTLTGLAAQLDSLITNNVNVLDPVLRDKLMHKIEPVKSAVQVLRESAGKGELGKQVWTMDAALDAQFLKTYNVLYELETVKKSHFSGIKRTVDGWKKFLENQYDLAYKNEVVGRFDDIKHMTKQLDNTNVEVGAGGGNSKFWKDVDELKLKVVEIGEQLQLRTSEVGSWKGAAKEVISEAKHKCDEIIAKLDDKEKHKITDPANELRAKAEELLTKSVEAKTQVTSAVEKALKTLQSLDEKVTQGLENFKARITPTISGCLTGLTGVKFSGGEATNFGSLKKTGPVGQWLKEIIKERGLHTYVQNVIHGNDASDIMEIIFNILKVPKPNGKTRLNFFKALETEFDGEIGQIISDNTNDPMQSLRAELNGDGLRKAVNDITLNLKSIADKGDQPILTSGIDSYFDSVQRCLSELSGTVNDLIENNGKISPNKKGLRPLLQELEGGLDTNTFRTASKHLQEIEHALGELKTNNVTEATARLQAVLAKIKQLENVPREIAQKKGEATNLMEQLKESMQDHFKTINDAVQYADTYISTAINAVKTVVKAAEKELTTQIRSLFAEQHIADLQALHTLVEQKLAEVREIIKVDKQIGVKGLLGKINGNKATLEEIKNNVDPSKIKTPEAIKKFPVVASDLKDFQDSLLQYIQNQVGIPSSDISRPPAPTKESQLVRSVNVRLDTLLDYLKNHNDITNPKTSITKKRIYIFDHKFSTLLSSLSSSIHSLSPSTFHGFHNPLLLDALKSGMANFTKELSHAYVNKYSGCKPKDDWVTKDKTADQKDVLSTEGRNCAKVCLTILERVSYDLAQLRSRCNDNKQYKNKQLYLYQQEQKQTKTENPLGQWLKKRGYRVPEDDKKQNGELKYDANFKGENIYGLLVNNDDNHVYKADIADNDHGPLRTLRRHLERYYKVSHHYISAKPKAPTSVNQMLQWLTGLQYNHIYDPLCKYMKQLFPKPKGDERDNAVISSDQLKLEYHQYATITHKQLTDTLETLCRQSEKMLITFLGHGHADGIYAVEFSNNSLNLLYPGSPATCLDMLIDLLNRVFYQLNFIYKMCHNGRSRGGWEECHYGRHVGGSNWNCNEKQCPNQNADQKGDQTCTQKHAQNCDQRVSCGLKSPLQSFLEDGLPGFLPHQFKKPGCKLECTVPNHQGIPCLTPMGFTDISQVASHTKTGKHLFGALYYFCGTTNALTKLCGILNCLLRTPPKSLGDMLAFYHKFLENYSGQNHKQIAFDEAARKANFGNPDTKLDIVSIQGSKSHTAKHSQGDLFGIISCNTSGSSKNPVVPCGSYMQPLTLDVVSMFSETRAANYLSWIVYITETFCVLLMKLLDECCNNCNKPGTKCHDKACAEKCEVKLAYEAEQSKNAPTSPAELTGKRHSTDCHSIVKCQLTHPTLYKYGFTFESPYDLSGEYGQQTRRTCIDLCHALEKLVGQNCVLVELIHKIDDFVCTIRHPFMCTLLALWSLSSLYLLHIAVVRLDVLRIRSHLKSPSSHRIAAQSLLAASRVKALANVKGKALDDIKERQSNLEDLTKKLRALIGEKDSPNAEQCKKLLENLIDGLENFLGYNKDSKGYTGSGIVYSDLDRLCDGVMSFLHGVLHNIKPKLGLHKNNIQSAIDSLNANKHSGKDGFNAAIVKVVEGVRQYNEGVKNSNQQVKNVVTTLQEYTKKREQGGMLLNDINDIQVDENSSYHQAEAAKKKVDARLDECGRKAAAFCNHLATKHNTFKNRDTIKEFNDKLRDRVLHVRGTIEYEKERLQKVHKQREEELKATTEKIKKVLEEREIQVNEHICREVTAVVEDLKNKVERNVLPKLQEVNRDLPKHVESLQQWIETADGTLGQAEERVKTILEQVDEGLTSNKIPIDEAVKKLEETKTALVNYISGESSGLKEMVNQVKETIGSLYNNVTGGSGPVQEENKSIEKIVDYIKKKVESIKGKVGEKKEKGQPLKDNKSIYQNWCEVKDKVTDFVKMIKGDGDIGLVSSHQGIKQIKEGVKTYAEGFVTKEKFVSTLEQWVKAILENDDAVKKEMKAYVTGNKVLKVEFSNVYIDDHPKNEFNMKGMKLISEKIKEGITTGRYLIAFPDFTFDENRNIDENVNEVKRVCEDFAKNLEDKILTAGVATVAREIAGKIEEQLTTNTAVDPDRKHLTYAVSYVLYQVVGRARQVGNEIQRLAETAKLHANLTQIDSNAGNINKQFTTDHPGAKIDTALEQVHGEIKTLHGNLEQALSPGSSGDPSNAKAVDTAIENAKLSASQLNVDPMKDAFTKWTQEIKSNFSVLTRAISEAGGTLLVQLRSFKNDKIGMKSVIKSSLQDLQQQLKALTFPVAEAVKRAEYFITGAEPTTKATITALQRDVKKELETAREALTTHATRQYVNALKTLLTEFAEKATKELDKLPQEIEEDLEQGHKKFMKLFEKHFITNDKSIRSIEDIQDKHSAGQKSPIVQASANLNMSFRYFLRDLKTQPDFKPDAGKIDPLYTSLTKLMGGLTSSEHFNHDFTNNLSAFKDTLSAFKPTKFGDGKNTSILNALKEGFSSLLAELQKAYVSTYSQQQIKWDNIAQEEKEKYAKISLTVMPILYQALGELKEGLENGWKNHKIYDARNADNSLHKLFFGENGYDVGRQAESLHGELNHRNNFNGNNILKHLNKDTYRLFHTATQSLPSLPLESGPDVISVANVEEDGLVRQLFDYLNEYLKACHRTIIEKPRMPCSIYEQLAWLSGLQFNSVFDPLCSYFKQLFQKPKDQKDVPYDQIEDKSLSLVGTKTIHPSHLATALHDVCRQSYPVLTSILGNGHADGVYAVDLCNNSFNLTYPSAPSQCFDMLAALLFRVYDELYFLLQQCSYTTKLSGWRDCWYGRHVGGSDWKCNTIQCPGQAGDQKADQMHEQRCNQKCEQNPKCELKSPLQSFLEDGLPGFLPHSIKKVGCGATCSLPSHSSIRCRTPMGFKNISVTASHTQKGEYIYDVLGGFCGYSDKPLSKLCSYISCVMHRPPQNLGDMFGFFYRLLDGWGKQGRDHKSDAFQDAVNGAYFGEVYSDLDVYSIFVNDMSNSHNKGSLACLVSCDNAYTPAHRCGSYLKPLCLDTCGIFSSSHKNFYLSWIVYLTETFYRFLRDLYEECCNNCGKKGTICHDKRCVKECKRKSASSSSTSEHEPECKSIVECSSMLPTLNKYGFHFGSTKWVGGKDSHRVKRMCNDFCSVLENVISETSALAKLVHETIPNFLWAIRTPFTYLLLALWSLSLLYLLHITVVRLDVLRIRSHLRSPSSHRIAAQSLLAAARVKALANVKYFSP